MTRKHWPARPTTILLLAGMITAIALAGLLGPRFAPARRAMAAGVIRQPNAPVPAEAAAGTPSFEVVSATGGHVGGVTVGGNYAYFAEGAGLTILDVSNALLPVQIARLVLPAIAEDVQLAGTLAYITTSTGLYIVDVSQAKTPAVLGSYATPGQARAVRIVAKRAYITVEGIYTAAVSDYVGKGLQIVDITAAASPALLGSYPTSDFPGDVQVIGNLAYLIHNDSHAAGVSILDITNPAQIIAKGEYAMPAKGGRAIKVLNGKAYIGYNNTATFDGGLQIVNVSTPSNPTLLGSYATVRPVWDVQITGNVAFLAAHTQLVALDIGVASKPSLISTHKLPGIAEALYDGLHVANGKAYLSTEAATHDQVVGIQIVDVATPAAPAASGAYHTLFSVGDTSNPDTVRLAGNFGYALNHGQVRAFDATTPARPVFMATSAPTTTYDLDIIGSRLYNAGGEAGLQIFDISNPNTPMLLGSYAEPGIRFERVRVAGNRAYVAAEFELKIIDISNPSNPVVLGRYQANGYAPNIQIVGTLVYLTTDSGLSIIDASDPANITAYAGYHPDTATSAVEVVGQLAYLVARGYDETNVGVVKQGLYIANISDPAHPQLLGRYATPGEALAVRVGGNRAYIAGLGEIWIVDISDPAHPTLLNTYKLPSQPGGMVIVGDLVYLAGGNAGLLVLRFQENIAQSGVVDANGGTLNVGETLALSFPAGAVASPVTVTYTMLRQPTQRLPSDWRALHSFTLTAINSSGQPVTEFAKPYTLVIGYTDAELAALGDDEANLNLAFWNGSAWVNALPCAGCGIDTVNNRLTVMLNHFTEFALVGHAKQVRLPITLR